MVPGNYAGRVIMIIDVFFQSWQTKTCENPRTRHLIGGNNPKPARGATVVVVVRSERTCLANEQMSNAQRERKREKERRLTFDQLFNEKFIITTRL